MKHLGRINRNITYGDLFPEYKESKDEYLLRTAIPEGTWVQYEPKGTLRGLVVIYSDVYPEFSGFAIPAYWIGERKCE